MWDLEVVRAGRVSYALSAEQVGAIEETTAQDVKSKQESYLRGRSDAVWLRDYTLCNVWTAAFFTPLLEQQLGVIPTTAVLFSLMTRPVSGAELGSSVFQKVAEAANALAAEKSFFHWCLEFPEVFQDGGFSCILGNPPWEQLQVSEQEFFASKDSRIAALAGASRKHAIKGLDSSNISLAQSFENTKYEIDTQNRFLKESQRFPLTAIGKMNTYAVFAETTKCLISKYGRVGIILPTGIATDNSTKNFIQNILESFSLASLYNFTNQEKIFPEVQGNISFSLMTISNSQSKHFFTAAQLLRTDDLKKPTKIYTLSIKDVKSINPNTLNLPIFGTAEDSLLIKKIYQSVPVFENETSNTNYWKASFKQGLFNMTSDSGCFRKRDELEKNGYILEHNLLIKEKGRIHLPLYESKLTDSFEHRKSTFKGILSSDMYGTHPHTNKLSLEDLESPDSFVLPRYWVPELDVESKIPKTWNHSWLIGFRNAISATADARSVKFTIIPRFGVGNSMPLIFSEQNTKRISALVANFNTLVLDYVAKQKASGGNLNFYVVKQLPILPPESYTPQDIGFISSRVLELVYTAWDMQPFAQDMGYAGAPFVWNPERRALLRAELDAKYAKLYGLTRDELRYILDPSDIYGPEFPSETFRVLKNKELKEHGEYRTQRLVLAAWDLLESGSQLPSDVQSIEDYQMIAVPSDPATSGALESEPC